MRVDDLENRWFVEPIAGLGYPPARVERFAWTRGRGRRRRSRPHLPPDRRARDQLLHPPDRQGRRPAAAPPGPTTAMGWEIHPESLGTLLRGLHDRHGFPRYVITENGAAMPDGRRADGRVDDTDRIDYLAVAPRRGRRGDRRRGAGRGVHGVVVARQLRVGPWVRAALRDRRGRPGHDGADPQGQRPLVRRRGAHRASSPAEIVRPCGRRGGAGDHPIGVDVRQPGHLELDGLAGQRATPAAGRPRRPAPADRRTASGHGPARRRAA